MSALPSGYSQRKKRALTSIRCCERPVCREHRLKTPTFGSAFAVKLCFLTSWLKPLTVNKDTASRV